VVTRAVNQGIAVIKLARRSPVAKSLQEIAHELSQSAGQESLLRKLFAFGKAKDIPAGDPAGVVKQR